MSRCSTRARRRRRRCSSLSRSSTIGSGSIRRWATSVRCSLKPHMCLNSVSMKSGVAHSDLFVLPADLHDCLHCSVLGTNHLEHPLVLRRSLEECGIVFVIRVLHGFRVATLTVIKRFMDESGNGLCAIGTHGARYPPEYRPLIQGTPHSFDRNARTQPGSLCHFNVI